MSSAEIITQHAYSQMTVGVIWLGTICMKCIILFSRKNKNEYFKMSSAEIVPSIPGD